LDLFVVNCRHREAADETRLTKKKKKCRGSATDVAATMALSALGETGTRIIFFWVGTKDKRSPRWKVRENPFFDARRRLGGSPPTSRSWRAPLCDTNHGGNDSTCDSGSSLEGTITISTTSSTRGTSRDEKGCVHFVFAICQKWGDPDNAAAAFFADKANLCAHQTECAQKKKDLLNKGQ
jgi:hypothetical protein